jgi:hypothetical protein
MGDLFDSFLFAGPRSLMTMSKLNVINFLNQKSYYRQKAGIFGSLKKKSRIFKRSLPERLSIYQVSAEGKEQKVEPHIE